MSDSHIGYKASEDELVNRSLAQKKYYSEHPEKAKNHSEKMKAYHARRKAGG